MREAGEYHAGEVQASEISVNDVAPAFLPHQGASGPASRARASVTMPVPTVAAIESSTAAATA